MNWGIIVQARSGSTRMPGKMLAGFRPGASLLEVVLERLLQVFPADRMVLATTREASDDALCAITGRAGVACVRGGTDDVLDRFIQAASAHGLDGIVRVCADNPFIQAERIHHLVEAGQRHRADYAAFFFSDGRPSILSHCGLFAEWASLTALRDAWEASIDKTDREHVTRYIYGHPERFRVVRLPVPEEDVVGAWRLTVDTRSDFDLCRSIDQALNGRTGIADLKAHLQHHPELLDAMRMNIEQNAK